MENNRLNIDRIKGIPNLEKEYEISAYGKSIQEIYEFYRKNCEDIDYFLDKCDQIRKSLYFETGIQTLEFITSATAEDINRIMDTREPWDSYKDFYLGITNSILITIRSRIIITRQRNEEVFPEIEAAKKEINDFRQLLNGPDGVLVEIGKIKSDLSGFDEIKTQLNGEGGLSDTVNGIRRQLDGSKGNDGLTFQIEKIKKDLNGDGTTVGISEQIRYLHNESSTLMPNVLTIFGVFASFITIVMVLVGTSSSWLDASSASSAFIAFAVPSGIGVLVVCALTALIQIIINNDNQVINWKPWIIIALLCVLVMGFPIAYGYKVEMPIHKRCEYVLADCETIEIDEDGSTIDAGRYVILSYRKDYSEQYESMRREYREYKDFIREGKIIYCLKHDCFE